MRFILITLFCFIVTFFGLILISKLAYDSRSIISVNTTTPPISMPTNNVSKSSENYSSKWKIKSIDTMKQSRDIARETIKDINLQKSIDIQMANIAKTGATHVGIGTPYDPEFRNVLKLWVDSARKHNLKVFFRGNFSGWEKWFGYKKISRDEHIQMTKTFIENNSDLFMDGDAFSSCPECENGEKLDRSNARQISEYKSFLIKEYIATKNSFKKINKKVPSNYYSMNGDIAFLMMDRQTTAAFDGVVVIDHYVKDTTRLERDIKELARKSGGKIILGEFGAPIPDIHGKMSNDQQMRWIEEALIRISKIPEVDGINYWVNEGGSTAIYNDDHTPKQAVNVIQNYFTN